MVDKDILIDVDGTVAALVEYTMARLKPKFPGAALPKHDMDGLLDKDGPLTDEQLAETFKLFASKGFVKNLPIIDGSLEGVKKLKNAFAGQRQIIWCTAPWISSETWDSDRRWWLEKKFHARQKDVVFTHHKYLVRGACLIDDKPDKLEAWKAANKSGLALLHDQPSNRDYKNPDIKRFRWSDTDWLIEELRKC